MLSEDTTSPRPHERRVLVPSGRVRGCSGSLPVRRAASRPPRRESRVGEPHLTIDAACPSPAHLGSVPVRFRAPRLQLPVGWGARSDAGVSLVRRYVPAGGADARRLQARMDGEAPRLRQRRRDGEGLACDQAPFLAVPSSMGRDLLGSRRRLSRTGDEGTRDPGGRGETVAAWKPYRGRGDGGRGACDGGEGNPCPPRVERLQGRRGRIDAPFASDDARPILRVALE